MSQLFLRVKGKAIILPACSKPSDATQEENALRALEHMFYILVWFVINYIDDEIQANLFDGILEPKAQASTKRLSGNLSMFRLLIMQAGKISCF